MRFVALAVCVSACTFEHGAASGPSDSQPPADARADARADAPLDTSTTPAACRTSDPGLVWCLEFDEANIATATTAIDGSGLHHDPSIANVTTVTRQVPAISQALMLSSTSTISIAKPSDFDVQGFTITAWVRRTSNAELGILDTDHQYTMSINSGDHTIECALSDGSQTQSYLGSAQTNANEWDLVACTFDTADVCTYAFHNGSPSAQSGCQSRTAPVAKNGTTTTVGSWVDGTSHFAGSIDQVRLYSRALTKQEICIAGGLMGC